MSSMKAHALDMTDEHGWTVDADLLGGCTAEKVDEVASAAVDAGTVAELVRGAGDAFARAGMAAGAPAWSVSFLTVSGRVLRTFTATAEGL